MICYMVKIFLREKVRMPRYHNQEEEAEMAHRNLKEDQGRSLATQSKGKIQFTENHSMRTFMIKKDQKEGRIVIKDDIFSQNIFS